MLYVSQIGFPDLLMSSYRLLRSYFASTSHWKDYDPFFESKAETYRSSSGAILRMFPNVDNCQKLISDLAKAINTAVQTEDLAKGYEEPGSKLEIAFL